MRPGPSVRSRVWQISSRHLSLTASLQDRTSGPVIRSSSRLAGSRAFEKASSGDHLDDADVLQVGREANQIGNEG